MLRAWNVGMENRKLLFSTLIFLSFTSGVLTAFQPVLTGQVVKSLDGGMTDATRNALIALFAIVIVDAAIQFTNAYLTGRVNEGFTYQLRHYTARIIGQMKLDGSNEPADGDLHYRLQNDTNAANQAFAATVPRAVTTLTVAIACVVGMAITIPSLFLNVFLVLVVMAVLIALVLRWTRHEMMKRSELSADYNGSVFEFLDSLKFLKSRNAEEWGAERLDSGAELVRKQGIRVGFVSGLMIPLLNIGTQLVMLVAILSALRMLANGDVEIAPVTTFIMFLMYAISPVTELGTMASTWNQGRAAVTRLVKVWDLPPEDGRDSERDLSLKGRSLQFRDVSFRYSDTEEKLFDKLSLNFEGPGFYKLEGSNGSGKSTLFNLATGIYPSESGEILVDGVPVEKFSITEWREKVLLVQQERVVWAGKVRDNIGSGAQYTDEEKLEAMRITGFDEHVDNLDTELGGEDGLDLSGGQKALLALTDVVLRKSDVVLLDEITAGVDQDSLPTVRRIIEELAKDSLVIAITHDEDLDQLDPVCLSVD